MANKKAANQATCADCGAKFELTFTPAAGKPVFCKNCFNKRKQERQSQRRPRQMFQAICEILVYPT